MVTPTPSIEVQVSRQSVRKLSDEPDFVTGLARPFTVEEFEVANVEALARPDIAYEEVLASIRSQIPSDGREVVDWMHEAAASEFEMEAFEEEYNDAAGHEAVFSRSGDGYIPGVRVWRCYYVRWRGSEVARRGYGVLVVRGITSFRVPRGGYAYRLFYYRNVLRAAEGVIGAVHSVQWDACIMFFRRLAEAPIRRRVRFPRPYGVTAPLHHIARFYAPVNYMRIVVTVDRPCRLRILMRDMRNLGRVYLDDEVELDRGQTEIVYLVLGSLDAVLSYEPRGRPRLVLDRVDIMP